MQVHGAHTGLTPSGNWVPTKSADTTSAGGIVSSTDQKRTDGTGGLIAILQARLNQVSDVRAEQIERARQALASGEYFTRSAAEATARAILEGQV
jgi:hypothetical protein